MAIPSVGTRSLFPFSATASYPVAPSSNAAEQGAARATGVADKVMISAAARNLAEADQLEGGSYDFTSLTPNQMKVVARDLHATGKIDPVQLFELENVGMPLGRLSADGRFVPLTVQERARYANTPVDYFRLANDALQFLESSGHAADPKSTVGEWRGIQAILQELQGRPASQN